MNQNYFSSPTNQYSTSYDYSYNYISPSTSSSYFYSPPTITTTPCPVHSSYNFYPAMPSMNISPIPYSYYPQEQQTQVYFSPPPSHSNAVPVPTSDRTPLRRHKCFKKNDLQLLHQAYNRDSHPSSESLQDLAVQLKVSVDKVRQWFKNRRHSEKLKKRDIPSRRSATSH